MSWRSSCREGKYKPHNWKYICYTNIVMCRCVNLYTWISLFSDKYFIDGVRANYSLVSVVLASLIYWIIHFLLLHVDNNNNCNTNNDALPWGKPQFLVLLAHGPKSDRVCGMLWLHLGVSYNKISRYITDNKVTRLG